MVVQQAREILKRELKQCVSPKGILAGTGHFDDLWARDSMFSVRGATSAGLYEAVQTSIRRLLDAEIAGRIPLKIWRGSQVLKFLKVHTGGRRQAMYANDKSSARPIDSGPLLLVGIHEYLDATGDTSFLEDWPRIERIYRRIRMGRDPITGLVTQRRFADWADSLRRTGSTSYAQILYCAAAESMAALAGCARQNPQPYRVHAQEARSALERFWNGAFFVESMTSGRWDAASNLLAVRYGLVDAVRAGNILESCTGHLSMGGLCPTTTMPGHPLREKSLWLVFLGMGDYHEAQCWGFIAALWLMALRTCDRPRFVKQRDVWAKKLVMDDGVFEVYEPGGRPVMRLFYRSEKPFAWGSAMMLEALRG